MSIRANQRNAAIDLLAAHIMKTGLSQTSLRQLAAAAKVSDRMLLYYFDDKTDVLAATMGRLADGLGDALANVIPAGTRLSPPDLIDVIAKTTRSAQMQPLMTLWIEIAAAAVRKEPPFAQISEKIAREWLVWIEDRLAVDDKKARRNIAAMILSFIDGLALVEACTDKRTAKRAIMGMIELQSIKA